MTEAVLLEAERELEFEAIDRGISRYREFRRKNAGAGRPEQMLAGKAIDALTDRLEELKRKVATQEVVASRGLKSWGPVVMYFPSEMLAACAISTTIQTIISQGAKKRFAVRQDVIRCIGDNVETMFHLLRARDMDKELFRILSKSMKKWDRQRARRFYKKVTGLNRAWSLAERTHIGGLLYSIVLEETGWFSERTAERGIRVAMDPEIVAELERAHEQMELLSPFQYPMVIPPADWGPDKGGGYIYHNYTIFKPVNAGDKPPQLSEAQPVYEAINALQRTGFKINRPVWEVMEQVWQSGGGWAGVPLKNPIISKTTGPRAEGSGAEEIKAAKAVRAKLWDDEAQEISPRMAMLYRKSVVDRMLKYDAFYYVYQMDWRGRIYPLCTSLSPQGDDLDRGLLTFSEEVEQTDEGRWWLKVHAANCWANDGLDKEDFDTRVRWTDGVLTRMRRVCADPLADKWWAEAENPWQFLAACFELCRTDGRTSLCVAIDGSCNGLQHYSAIGLDEVGGLAVNLVPGSKPRDIYATVAGAVRVRLAAGTDRPALPLITRKVVKRAVMTLPYGLTPIGMRDQFISDGHMDGLPDPYASANFLRDLTWSAIGDVVVKAVEYMAWLKMVAAEANKAGLPLQWTTPTGMVVTQDYVVPQSKCMTLPGLGNTVFRVYPADGRVLHKTKQMNGICPNFIHSYDAAHLMLTVCAAKREGVTSFWMIHDSYGTHAPRVAKLGRILREQFVNMYTENPLERFKQDTERRLTEHTGKLCTLPPLPPRGKLALPAVKESSYFFA